jgi:hypothetical protein
MRWVFADVHAVHPKCKSFWLEQCLSRALPSGSACRASLFVGSTRLPELLLIASPKTEPELVCKQERKVSFVVDPLENERKGILMFDHVDGARCNKLL